MPDEQKSQNYFDFLATNNGLKRLLLVYALVKTNRLSLASETALNTFYHGTRIRVERAMRTDFGGQITTVELSDSPDRVRDTLLLRCASRSVGLEGQCHTAFPNWKWSV